MQVRKGGRTPSIKGFGRPESGGYHALVKIIDSLAPPSFWPSSAHDI